jgi:flagellar export protein FliJ
MKRFTFRLERILEWRRGRMEAEQRALERLLAERARLEAQQAFLESALEAARRSVREASAAGQTVEAQTLVALENFSRSIRREQSRLLARRAELERTISAQRERLISARRDYRLLEKLRARALAAWERDYAREVEALASELHLARWRGPRD